MGVASKKERAVGKALGKGLLYRSHPQYYQHGSWEPVQRPAGPVSNQVVRAKLLLLLVRQTTLRSECGVDCPFLH